MSRKGSGITQSASPYFPAWPSIYPCGAVVLGKALPKHAPPRINGAIETLSGRAVVVHALDDEAMKFHARYGFESSPIDSKTMMLLVKDMRASLAQAGGKREE